MKNSISIFLKAVLVSVMAILLSSTIVYAAPPPPGYPTSQIMAQVKNSKYGTIPLRRGFYDSATNKGWGMDKAWHKHNLYSLNAQSILLKSPNGAKQGNGNIDLKTYVGKYNCPSKTSKICNLEKQLLVHAIYAPNDANYIQGWKVGGKVGLLTAYCSNDSNAKDCPDWVTYSLDNPRTTNPYSRSLGEDQPSAPATGAPATGTAQDNALYRSSYFPLSQSESK